MKNVIVAGAAPGTGNLGVSALCDSMVNNLSPLLPNAEFSVLDFGNGVRKKQYSLNDGAAADLVGAKVTKRVFNESSFLNIYFQWLTGVVRTETARKFTNSVVLDVSGGDSFTDLYGEKRFRLTSYPKELAQKSSSSLILMPQTIGPFSSEKVKRKGIDYLTYSDLVYTRDSDSYEYLKELLGSRFNPEQHKQGVDMAFLLDVDNNFISQEVASLNGSEIVGINVSGLIYNNREEAKNRYGIKCDYNKVIKTIVEKVLTESHASIILIPHVLVPESSDESDYAASVKLKESLPSILQKRVQVLKGSYDQRQVKSIISQCDWFCGTRMHATIAGLSSAVPTVNIAYSGKSRGVFESVGQEDCVFDARVMNDEQLISGVIASWENREAIRPALEAKIAEVKTTARSQMLEIGEVIKAAT